MCGGKKENRSVGRVTVSWASARCFHNWNILSLFFRHSFSGQFRGRSGGTDETVLRPIEIAATAGSPSARKREKERALSITTLCAYRFPRSVQLDFFFLDLPYRPPYQKTPSPPSETYGKCTKEWIKRQRSICYPACYLTTRWASTNRPNPVSCTGCHESFPTRKAVSNRTNSSVGSAANQR